MAAAEAQSPACQNDAINTTDRTSVASRGGRSKGWSAANAATTTMNGTVVRLRASTGSSSASRRSALAV